MNLNIRFQRSVENTHIAFDRLMDCTSLQTIDRLMDSTSLLTNKTTGERCCMLTIAIKFKFELLNLNLNVEQQNNNDFPSLFFLCVYSCLLNIFDVILPPSTGIVHGMMELQKPFNYKWHYYMETCYQLKTCTCTKWHFKQHL